MVAARVGLFLCDCDGKLASRIDFDDLTRRLHKQRAVSFVVREECLCDEQGLKFIQDRIGSSKADRAVIGACASKTFVGDLQERVKNAGISPFFLSLVNLRDECALVHDDQTLATEKANLLMLANIEAVKRQEPIGAENVKIAAVRTTEKVDRREFFRLLTGELGKYRALPSIQGDVCLSFRGCRECVRACPFEALSYERGGILVSKERCEVCGICIPFCPVGAIELPACTDDQIIAQLESLLGERGKLSPRIPMFLCEGVRGLVDSIAESGFLYPPNVLPLIVPCVGILSGPMLLYALNRGAEGVITMGCPSGKCPYKSGNVHVKDAVSLAKGVLRCFGAEDDRIDFVEISEVKIGELVKRISDSVEKIRSLRPRPALSEEPAPVTRGRRQLVSLVKSLSKKIALKPALIETSYLGRVKIDEKACTGCEVCTKLCPTGALRVSEGKGVVKMTFEHYLCTNCGICEDKCPEHAINVEGVVDLIKLTRPVSLFEEGFAICPRCGKAFVSQKVVQRVQNILSARGEEVSDAIRLCPKCKTESFLGGFSNE